MKKGLIVLVALLIGLSFAPASFAANAVPTPVIDTVSSVLRIGVDYAGEISTGSSFVIKNNGKETLIATNHHVIEGVPCEIFVWYNDVTIDAEIVADSQEKDIAILRLNKCIEAKALTIDGNPQLGEAVYGIGFPSAADALSDYIAVSSDDATLTDGIISAIRKLTIRAGGQSVRIIQTNADINSGNSGGPLLNEDGEVLGINTYGVLDSQGINGAISAKELISLAEENSISLYQSSNTNQGFEPSSTNNQKSTQTPIFSPMPSYIPTSMLVDSGNCGINAKWEYFEDGTLYISGTGEMENYFRHDDWLITKANQPWNKFLYKIKSAIIENGISSIGDCAFLHCENLITVTIPDSVTSIGKDAFQLCKNLINMTIPNDVTVIGSGAFSYCERLEHITIPDGVLGIDVWTFYNCLSLSKVTIPNSIIVIGNQAFYNCSGLKEIDYLGTEQQWYNIIFLGDDIWHTVDAVVRFKQNFR